MGLTVAVQAGVTAGLDRAIEHHTGALSSGNWSYIELSADPLVATVVFAAALYTAWRRSAMFHPAPWAVAFLAGQLAELALKSRIDQIPFSDSDRILGLWVLPGSYPSGHAMRAVLLAGMASAVAPRWRWVWIAYAAGLSTWVLVSGMHLATDTLGGVLLGGTLVAAVNGWTAMHTHAPIAQTAGLDRCPSEQRRSALDRVQPMPVCAVQPPGISGWLACRSLDVHPMTTHAGR